MEAGIPTRLTPPTSIHLSNSSIAITQPFPALPGRCWGPTNPSPLSAAQPCCQSQLSPLLTPPSCLWCLWHFPLQHFQAPVAPQPRQLRHSHGRANSNTRRLRSSPRQSLCRGRAAGAGASLASGCPPRPHTRQTHKLTPQSSSSGGAECSAQGSTPPDWGTNTTMAQLWKTQPQGQQQSSGLRTDSQQYQGFLSPSEPQHLLHLSLSVRN